MPKISMPKSRNGRIVTAVGGVIGLCLIFACVASGCLPTLRRHLKLLKCPNARPRLWCWTPLRASSRPGLRFRAY